MLHVSPTVQTLPSQSLGSQGGRVVDVVAVGRVLIVVVDVVVEGALRELKAASASIRPNPAASSKPGGPISTAVDVRTLRTWAGVRFGFLLSSSAATAAECGAAADVPRNGLNSPPSGSVVTTPSNPARSGFGRVAGEGKKMGAGPLLLKVSTTSSPGVWTLIAATVITS